MSRKVFIVGLAAEERESARRQLQEQGFELVDSEDPEAQKLVISSKPELPKLDMKKLAMTDCDYEAWQKKRIKEPKEYRSKKDRRNH